jgi:mRNA interferase YafQ
MPMNDTLYEVKQTSQFKRDYKLAKKRGQNIGLLHDVILKLANGEKLPENNRDHALTGDWDGFRECHITPDWLLIYKVEDDILVLTLTRIGTHSDLDF